MKDRLLELSARIDYIKSKIKNEEATKQSLILPMLSILGYDIFNPDEVGPEVSCDITGKGDRIDYIIYKEGTPAILVECKDWKQNPEVHVNQLRKYFVASEAKFAIITNGIRYLFFSDHDKANIMDEKPFYSLNMLSLSDEDISFLRSISRDSFNTMQLACKSQDMIYRNAILKNLRKELHKPTKGFISLLTSDVFKGKLTAPVYDKFSGMVKECLELVLEEGFSKDEDLVKEDIKEAEESCNYTEDEQKLIEIVMGWLRKYETERFHIYVRRLADGYIRFCYHNEWWNICRIKIRPKFEDKLCIKICKDGIYSKSDTLYKESIEAIDSVRSNIESQCEDTKSRFFSYRVNHNL